MIRFRLLLILIFMGMLGSGCRTTASDSQALSNADGSQKSGKQAYSIWVRDGKVQKVTCDGAGTPRKMKNWSLKDDCKIIAQADLSQFKADFTKLYLAKENKKSMSSKEQETLDAAIATATIDGDHTKVKKLPSAEFHELLAKYYSMVDKALNQKTPSEDQEAVDGYNLASAPFLNEFLNVPFGGVALSPAFILTQPTLAKKISVKVSGQACGAVVSGVNIGQNTFNLGALKPIGNGEFVSNFPNKTVDIRVIQVVMSQTFFNFGQCNLTATVVGDGGSGGFQISGFDFGGKRSCQVASAGIACPAVVDAVQSACSNIGGNSQTCNDCSTLCSKSLSVPNQDNWKLAGHIHYNGGFIPAIDLAVLPVQFVSKVRIDQPVQCPGASILDVKVRAPLGATLSGATLKSTNNEWQPNGGKGAVITSIVASINGPFFVGGCNIPVFISTAKKPVPVGLPIMPNPPVAVGLPIGPPPVAVGLPVTNFDPDPQPLGLPVIDNSPPMPVGMPIFTGN